MDCVVNSMKARVNKIVTFVFFVLWGVAGCMVGQPITRASLGKMGYIGKDYSCAEDSMLLIVQCTGAENDDYFNENLPDLSALVRRVSPEQGEIRAVQLNAFRNCIYLKGHVYAKD